VEFGGPTSNDFGPVNAGRAAPALMQIVADGVTDAADRVSAALEAEWQPGRSLCRLAQSRNSSSRINGSSSMSLSKGTKRVSPKLKRRNSLVHASSEAGFGNTLMLTRAIHLLLARASSVIAISSCSAASAFKQPATYASFACVANRRKLVARSRCLTASAKNRSCSRLGGAG
jgi:hypothetical protein